jgi:hypothetical protein
MEKTLSLCLLGAAALAAQTPVAPQALLNQQVDALAAAGGGVAGGARGGVAGGVRGGVLGAVVRMRVETGKPYSATVVTQTKMSYVDGTNVTRSNTQVEYRDADGRERMENEIPDGHGSTIKRIVIRDPVAGVTYNLNSATKTAFSISAGFQPAEAWEPVAGGRGGVAATSKAGDEAAGAKRDANHIVEDLGFANINGVSARGTRSTTIVAAGSIGNDREFRSVEERWFSPELNMMVKTTSTDPRFGTTTRELTNINRANPDPSLFKPPADYTVTTRGGRGQ